MTMPTDASDRPAATRRIPGPAPGLRHHRRPRRPRPDRRARRAARPARPLRLRQDHRAARASPGFEQPDAGEVLVDGEDITRVPANRRDAGMVFQSYSLFPNLNARDNVAFGLRVRKVPRRRAPRPRRRAARPRRPARRTATATRTSSPAASSSASRWPARWRCEPARAAARRAAVRARRQGAAHAARGDPPAPARPGHHHHLRHPRPGGGPVDGRPGRRAARRAAGAVRGPRRAVRPARHRRSSPSSSAP